MKTEDRYEKTSKQAMRCIKQFSDLTERINGLAGLLEAGSLSVRVDDGAGAAFIFELTREDDITTTRGFLVAELERMQIERRTVIEDAKAELAALLEPEVVPDEPLSVVF